jgi:hypothetical protein
MPVPQGSNSWYFRSMEYNNALVVMGSYRVPVETGGSPYQQQDEVVSSKVGGGLLGLLGAAELLRGNHLGAQVQVWARGGRGGGPCTDGALSPGPSGPCCPPQPASL